MNKIGMYFAYWEKEWEADYCYYIDKVKRLGFDVLELAAGSLPGMGADKRRKIAARAADAGIELTCCIGLPAEYDLAGEDIQIRRNGIAYVKTLLDCIAEMDGNILGGILYSCWPGPVVSYEYKQEARKRSIESLQAVAEKAAACRITCCLEVVNRFEQYLLNCVDEAVDFVREIDNPWIRLLLDSFHMNIEEDSFYEAIVTAGPYLKHFHIGESNRKTPGRGHIDWQEIAAALKAADYQGHIVMEPFIRPGGQVGRDIKIYRDQSGRAGEAQMDALAAEALGFMRTTLK